jgi:type VII secretion integral membrane protein EccD
LLTSYSRVTVVNGTRRVDLALPSALPLADVVPQVLRFCAPDEQPHQPAEFSLARVGGQVLSLSQSLAEAGVRDGDVVELRAFTAESRPALVEDVRDAIEDTVDAAGGVWTSRSTVTFSVVATCTALGLVALPLGLDLWRRTMAGEAASDVAAGRAASELVAALVVLAVTWVATRWAAPWSVYVSGGTAAVLALLGTTHLVAAQEAGAAVALTAGLAAGTAVAGLARLFTQRASVLLAAGAVALAATAAVAAGELLGADTSMTVRVVAVLAVLSIGVLPRVSLAVGGLSSADYRLRNAGRLTDDALQARFRESSGLLLGTLFGVSLVVGLVGFWLGLRDDEWSQDIWDRALSLSLAFALLLRSRVFSRTQAMLPLRVAGVFVLLGNVLQQAVLHEVLDTWLLAAVALVGALLVAVSILSLSDITRPRVRRLLNAIEFVVVVDLVVVTMGAVAVYDVVRS